MVKISRGHTIKAGITLVVLLLLTEGAGAVREINSCTDITSPDTYVLSTDIVNSGASRCINITSSNVILDGAGYTIDGTGAEDTYSIYVYDPAGMGLTNVNIKNLRITDWYYGIYHYGNLQTVNGRIENNTISSRTYGITLYEAKGYTLNGNTAGGIEIVYSNNINITNNNAGIALHHSYGNIITNNNASSKGGITLHYASENTVTDNDVSSNYYGISTSYAANNIIANNRAIGSIDAGFSLGPMTQDNTITDNNISSNKYGLYLYYATGNTIKNNIIRSNSDYGIYLSSSGNNTIYNNDFNNANNAWDDGNNIWNTRKTAGTNIIGGSWLGGNYWSDYAGEDINRDGLGETLIPYNSSGNIMNDGDYLPLVSANIFYGITGTGFNDMNRNRVRDAEEEGLENWVMQLKGTEKHTGRIIKRTATTGINGNYVFDDLKPGFYIISEVRKQGWIPTTSPARSVRLGEGENTIVDFGNKRIR